jgi:hypothetical protein
MRYRRFVSFLERNAFRALLTNAKSVPPREAIFMGKGPLRSIRKATFGFFIGHFRLRALTRRGLAPAPQLRYHARAVSKNHARSRGRPFRGVDGAGSDFSESADKCLKNKGIKSFKIFI